MKNGQPPEASPHQLNGAAVKVIAVVTDYDTLHAAMRARKDELDVSCQVIDRAGALTGGHASKLLAPQPIKRANWETLSFLLPALGLRLALLEDADAIEQLRKFPTRKVDVPMRAVTRRNGRHARKNNEVSLRHMRRIARQGGEARAQKLSARQLSAIGRKAARKRWHAPKVVDITKRAPGRPGAKTAREKSLGL